MLVGHSSCQAGQVREKAAVTVNMGQLALILLCQIIYASIFSLSPQISS